jgi:hypothetical protein
LAKVRTPDNPFLDDSTVAPEGVFFIIVGRPGAGKSSLLGQIPKSLFYYHVNDRGVQRLRRRNLIPPETKLWHRPFRSWGTFRKELVEIRETMLANDLKTLVLEGLGGIVEIMKHDAVDVHYGGTESAYDNFGKGVRKLRDQKTYIPWLLAQIDLFTEADLNVILTSHSEDESDTDVVSGESFKTAKPEVPTTILNRVAGKSELVGFLTSRPKFVKANAKVTLSNGSGGTYREFTCHETAFCKAKNNHGITEPMELDGTPAENWKKICQGLKISRSTLKSL